VFGIRGVLFQQHRGRRQRARPFLRYSPSFTEKPNGLTILYYRINARIIGSTSLAYATRRTLDSSTKSNFNYNSKENYLLTNVGA
jgi:hypothetical protein